MCVDNFNTQAAFSICRQLGYSSGTYHAGETVKAIDLTNLLCNGNTGSFRCFSHCFNNESYSLTDERDCHEVYIDCGKNITIIKFYVHLTYKQVSECAMHND